MKSGDCYACGQSKKTYGCHVCNDEGGCKRCTSGMELDEDGLCIAETIDNTISTVPFIIAISLLGLSIVLLIGKIFTYF